MINNNLEQSIFSIVKSILERFHTRSYQNALVIIKYASRLDTCSARHNGACRSPILKQSAPRRPLSLSPIKLHRCLTGRSNIRFKAGREPGTEDYTSRLAKSKNKRRSGYPQTQVTVGDTTIYWGCGIDPVTTLGNVSNICATSGQCIDTDSFSTSVTYATPGANEVSYETLAMTATGTYPSWIHNGLVEGLQAAMSAQGVITSSIVTYMVSIVPLTHDGALSKPESCQVAQAPNFIGFGVYSALNTLEATIEASIALQTQTNGFCTTMSSIAGAIAGAFGPVGADLAAIFGVVSATCSL